MSELRLPPLELDEYPEPVHDCLSGSALKPVDHPANAIDAHGPSGSQGYQMYRCSICRDYWGCRFQYDPGTGADDRWHRFGEINPDEIRRHY